MPPRKSRAFAGARSSGAGMAGYFRFFQNRKHMPCPSCRSRLTALRFALRICGGRAITGPPLHRSQQPLFIPILFAPTFL